MIEEMELLSIMRREDERRCETTPIARGKWIPLGHQIGFLKHPWSEDYRCSLCGYEAYTIGTPPPSICPQCHANNTIYEGENQKMKGVT